MPTRMIHCTYCGLDGEIEIPGLEPGVPQSRVFTHHGHNPLSGHMFYQCPACQIILHVNPLDVLDETPFEGIAFPAAYGVGLNRRESGSYSRMIRINWFSILNKIIYLKRRQSNGIK